MKRFVELLADVIATGVRLEAEKIFELGHVAMLAVRSRAAPMHRVTIDAAAVTFDVDRRGNLFHLGKNIQTLGRVAVRDEPENALSSTRRLLVQPRAQHRLRQRIGTPTEQAVSADGHFAAQLVTDRPVELDLAKETVVDHRRRLVRPQNPQRVGARLRPLRNFRLVVLNVVGVENDRVGLRQTLPIARPLAETTVGTRGAEDQIGTERTESTVEKNRRVEKNDQRPAPVSFDQRFIANFRLDLQKFVDRFPVNFLVKWNFVVVAGERIRQ